LFRDKSSLVFHMITVTVANLTGAVVVTIIVMRLAAIPLIISIIAATISGIVGGIISYSVFNKLVKFKLV